jgi:RAB protein geranylgeranyltransferase component A
MSWIYFWPGTRRYCKTQKELNEQCLGACPKGQHIWIIKTLEPTFECESCGAIKLKESMDKKITYKISKRTKQQMKVV